MTFGVGELFGAVVTIIGAGWVLLRLTFSQYDDKQTLRFKALDEKFGKMETVMHDVKRLELEQIRVEGRMSIAYATKEEMFRMEEKTTKTLERVFGLLTTINEKLDGKVSRDECERVRETHRKTANEQ